MPKIERQDIIGVIAPPAVSQSGTGTRFTGSPRIEFRAHHIREVAPQETCPRFDPQGLPLLFRGRMRTHVTVLPYGCNNTLIISYVLVAVVEPAIMIVMMMEVPVRVTSRQSFVFCIAQVVTVRDQ